MISNDGHWTGVPFTGSQTPWTSEIDANFNNLKNIVNITSRDNTYYLHNQPLYSGDHIMAIAGPGILIMPTGGGYPRADFQSNSITMLDSGGAQMFHVDLYGNLNCNSIQLNLANGQDFIYSHQFGVPGYWGAGGPRHATKPASFTFQTGDGRTVTVRGGLITDCV